MLQTVPLVLMTGFGYDPGHSIVKAKQAGLQAVLYKPFRLDQLLETVELIIGSN
jgi:FixJ family two-component response regulator